MNFRVTRTRMLCAALLLAPLTPAAAQTPTNPALQEIIRLSQDTYGDSARALIAKLLARTPTTDPLYPEALFTAAMVAKTGEEMKIQFSRVAIEFSSSAWADKAMLRLAQLDYGSGNSEAAVSRIRRLFTDYPTSTILPAAALWGSRAAFDRKEIQLGCEWIGRGLALVGDDVELRNQLEFSKQRCNVGAGVEVAPPRPDSLRSKPIEPATPPTVTKPAPQPVATTAAGAWRIQVAAISDKAAIRKAVGKIEKAGFKAFQVAGPRGLTKLQAGPFKSREAAVAKLKAIKAALGGAPFVVQVP
ncbi:MAG: SPOR domain-containing protein [Gemmatimonadales bacterium]